MSQGTLTAFIEGYIAERRQAKLKAFDKEITKRRAAGEDEHILLLARQETEARYTPVNWLTDAASRAGQISPVTHAAKYTHGYSKSSSVYSNTRACEGYLSTATLDDPSIDMVVDAAVLDVAKLLQTDVAGDSLLAAFQRQDYRSLAPFASSDEQLQQWIAGFRQALIAQDPTTSHKLAKQIYFLVGDGYHLLSPLFSSSLAQALHQKIVASRFSEQTKALRQAQKKRQWRSQPLIAFPGTAEIHFGGSNPQNISALNTARGGRCLLLSAQPPRWQCQNQPPKNMTSLFAARGAFDRMASSTIKQIASLMNATGTARNRQIRETRDREIDDIIDRLFMMVSELQREAWQGWSCQSPELKRHQQLWLDPWRCREDEAFRLERDSDEWQNAIVDDFARWLNARLRGHLSDVGKTERREWETRPLFRQRLREMEAMLHEAMR